MAIDVSGVLARPYIVLRNDHQEVLGAGLAVTGYALERKSAEEMRELWQWVSKKLAFGSPDYEQPANDRSKLRAVS